MLRIAFVSLVICASAWTYIGASGSRTNDANDVGDVILVDRLGRQAMLSEGQTVTVQELGLSTLARVHVARGHRATLCASASTTAVCRRYVGANEDLPTGFTPTLTAVTTIVTVERALFGFADLHLHPATHLAWGSRGGKGMLWGKPGMAHTTLSLPTDLTVCNDFHSTPASAGQLVTRPSMVIIKDPRHGYSGPRAFADWPSAESVLHQQMHVTMLRRAYLGGLRLMVASVTDNQMLDIIWNPDFSISQGRFALREDADHKAAITQIEFIQRFVAANASWMAIAKTPDDARQAIEANKLAVVLGLEMDELSAEEILDLRATYGVGLVVPVHLVNNSFGGAAVYEPMFNVANYVMNGDLFRVEHGAELVCRDPAPGDGIADPQVCTRFKFDGIPSLPLITDLMGNVGTRLAEYASTTPGHRNRVGLLDEYGIRRLMRAGLLIDTAHMSSRATTHTISIAKPSGYPLVHSHGGLLWGETAAERSLTNTQYQAHADSGGILGLGTGENAKEDPVNVRRWFQRYLDVAKRGAIALGSDLNGMAEQIAHPGIALPYPTDEIQGADWTGNVGPLSKFRLGDKQFDILEDGIAHVGMLPDFLAAVRRHASGDQVRVLDQVFHSAHDFIATWEKATRASARVDPLLPPLNVSQLLVTIETGTDNLKCGGVVVTAFKLVDGASLAISPAMFINRGLSPHSTFVLPIQIGAGTSLRDVYKIRFQYPNNKCDPFDTGDTWNIKTLKVTYNIATGTGPVQGVLMHKRGAPAKKLARGSSWTVYTER